MTPRPAAQPVLEEHLRVILGSPQKLAILCLLERADSSSTELNAQMVNPVSANTLNAHLVRLEELGVIHVVDTRRKRGAYERVWALSTAPTWNRLARWIIKNDPLRAEHP